MRPPALAELQSEFKRYLFAGDNEARLAGWVDSASETPAESRLDVYRSAYYTRLQEALAHDFPALLAVAGDEAFGALATSYLADYPSTRPSLRWLGQHLPSWLRRKKHTPVLADLAALEWAVLHAFDAAEAPAVTAASLVNLPAERWPELRVAPHSSVSFLAAQTNARELWLAVRKSAALPVVRPIQDRLVIWRSRRGPAVEAVSREAYTLLCAMAGEATFATACEALSWSIPKEDIPRLAAECLHNALARGWIGEITAA
ncbi:MAG: DNA-binding domain-containing protein [Thermoanaerobaculia bacterium]